MFSRMPAGSNSFLKTRSTTTHATIDLSIWNVCWIFFPFQLRLFVLRFLPLFVVWVLCARLSFQILGSFQLKRHHGSSCSGCKVQVNTKHYLLTSLITGMLGFAHQLTPEFRAWGHYVFERSSWQPKQHAQLAYVKILENNPLPGRGINGSLTYSTK